MNNQTTITTRVRGFAPWSPQKRTLLLLDQVNEVLDEYRDYLPLTIRQVFYRLVGNHNFDKTELAYNRLCETMNRARRAGLIPFSAIRDDGVTRYSPHFWANIEQVMDTIAGMADRYNLDRQRAQPVRLLVMCEANGMAPMLANVVEDLGVPVMSSGGFDSVTAKHSLARELATYDRAEILHVGDYDPSGEHVFNALAEDVFALCAGLNPGSTVGFSRLAVTPEQIEDFALPSAPPKKTDKRSFTGKVAVQAEAIPPDVLTDIVRQAVIDRQDQELRSDTLAMEELDREKLRGLIGGDE